MAQLAFALMPENENAVALIYRWSIFLTICGERVPQRSRTVLAEAAFNQSIPLLRLSCERAAEG
jgi:hypothetical protein